MGIVLLELCIGLNLLRPAMNLNRVVTSAVCNTLTRLSIPVPIYESSVAWDLTFQHSVRKNRVCFLCSLDSVTKKKYYNHNNIPQSTCSVFQPLQLCETWLETMVRSRQSQILGLQIFLLARYYCISKQFTSVTCTCFLRLYWKDYEVSMRRKDSRACLYWEKLGQPE